ncbi:MAG TPA: GxxExxY protein [Candidatus Cloacimonadota bacterium]|nr:GxxExxY protein [Candidatus Cloacimonadota bacterium]
MEENLDSLCQKIIGAAIEVHKTMGPGLLEKIYLQCFCKELDIRGLMYEREKQIPLVYKGQLLDAGLRADLIVENLVIVELKSVLDLNHVFEAQLISYLTLSGMPTGLLINFNVPSLKDGIKRLFPIRK